MANPLQGSSVGATGDEQLWVHDDRLLRTRPTQRRAFERVAHILDAAGELLDELYPAPVTAEQIAKHANVRLATFYHYFHGHQAVYGALAARSLERMRAAGQAASARAAGRVPLYQLVSAATDVSIAAWSGQPGARHLLSISQGMPEFQERLDDWIADAIEIDRVAPIARDPEQWKSQRKYVYETMLRSFVALAALVLATEDPEDRRRFTEEAKLALTAYLSIYLA